MSKSIIRLGLDLTNASYNDKQAIWKLEDEADIKIHSFFDGASGDSALTATGVLDLNEWDVSITRKKI